MSNFKESEVDEAKKTDMMQQVPDHPRRNHGA
jgi:hypothetical protein